MIRLISKAIVMLTVLGLFGSCLTPKTNVLYIDNSTPDTSFYSADILFKDLQTAEFWTSTEECLYAEVIPEAGYQSSSGLYLRWDAQSEGCPWQGIGFGWDNWTGKDLSKIKNEGAIEFYVRMPEGERSSLPWAFGLEDYSNAQAWLGVNPNTVMADKITTEWTRVVLPLSEFNWKEQDADITNIKQAILQLDASGEIYIDEMRIVPYKGGFRKRANITEIAHEDFKVDAEMNDAFWTNQGHYFGPNEVHLAIAGEELCIGLLTTDPDPLQNSNIHDGAKCFEGDGLEILFGTDTDAPAGRLRFLSTDQHLTIALGDEVTVYDNRRKKFLEGIETAVRQVRDGYVLEARIPVNMLTENKLSHHTLYGLEMAVNHGNKKERVRQDRWNTPNKEGYYENPSIWGEMLITELKGGSSNP